eukprot:COSAG01_NODE_1233_length_11110_cov_13.006902_10_plen_370_part_00
MQINTRCSPAGCLHAANPQLGPRGWLLPATCLPAHALPAVAAAAIDAASGLPRHSYSRSSRCRSRRMHLFACCISCICAAALSTVSATDVAARLAAERLLAGEDRVSLGVGSPDAVRLPDHDASAAGCGEKKCYLVLHEHFYANDASGYGARAPPYRDRAPAIVAASEHHSKVLIKVKVLSKWLPYGDVLRHTLTAHPDWVVFQGDERCAFQHGSRDEMRRMLLRHFPAVIPFFEGAYGGTSSLFYEGHQVDPACTMDGTQQGCSMGTFLYCLSRIRDLLALQERHPRVLFLFIADDAYMAGPPDAVAAAVPEWRTCVHRKCLVSCCRRGRTTRPVARPSLRCSDSRSDAGRGAQCRARAHAPRGAHAR